VSVIGLQTPIESIQPNYRFHRAAAAVLHSPMSIWVHVISNARPSSAVLFVKPVIACFVRVYGALLGRGVVAARLPLLTMRPPGGDCDLN